MAGFRLTLETFESSNGVYNYQSNVRIGSKTPIAHTLTKLKRDIKTCLVRMENNLLNPTAKSRIPKYHIYISDIVFTQYTI